MIDEGFVSDGGDIHQRFVDFFEAQMAIYPKQEAKSFSIVHCHRDGYGMSTVMRAWELSWSQGGEWSDVEIKIPDQSGEVISRGSGRKWFKIWNSKFQASDIKGTSRSIFQAFCKMLQSNSDPFCGGAPQLVSLIRVGNGKQHGIAWYGEAWLAGMKIDSPNYSSKTEYFNELMERVDPRSLTIKSEAQRQPLPSDIEL